MAMKMKGMGKGLDALLGKDFSIDPPSSASTLPINQVESCNTQPRKYFNEEKLAELAESIREHGIIQPLTVRKLSSGTIRSSPASAAGGPPAWRVSARSPWSSSRPTTARPWSWP